MPGFGADMGGFGAVPCLLGRSVIAIFLEYTPVFELGNPRLPRPSDRPSPSHSGRASQAVVSSSSVEAFRGISSITRKRPMRQFGQEYS